eukprot:scaffold95890_cov61-Phaeocystis_antarctica.AAC.1
MGSQPLTPTPALTNPNLNPSPNPVTPTPTLTLTRCALGDERERRGASPVARRGGASEGTPA